jgi:hypothetical protein
LDANYYDEFEETKTRVSCISLDNSDAQWKRPYGFPELTSVMDIEVEQASKEKLRKQKEEQRLLREAEKERKQRAQEELEVNQIGLF